MTYYGHSKKDTLEFNVASFKTKEDANVDFENQDFFDTQFRNS